jgi:hypothetical protein
VRRYIKTLFIVISLTACKSPKTNYDLTFFKWNIHESYYLKFNSSDTLYFINTYPLEEQTSFTILNEEEKEKIQTIIDTLTFPRQKEYTNRSIDDGETFVFELKNIKQSKQLKIHGHRGPNQFWLFGKSLETIKNQHTFTKTNKSFDLTDFNKMIISPIPTTWTCKDCPKQIK